MQKENVLRKRDENAAKGKKANGEDKNLKNGEEEDEDGNEDVDMYEDEWDSEGLEGAGELEAKERDDTEVVSG